MVVPPSKSQVSKDGSRTTRRIQSLSLPRKSVGLNWIIDKQGAHTDRGGKGRRRLGSDPLHTPRKRATNSTLPKIALPATNTYRYPTGDRPVKNMGGKCPLYAMYASQPRYNPRIRHTFAQIRKCIVGRQTCGILRRHLGPLSLVPVGQVWSVSLLRTQDARSLQLPAPLHRGCLSDTNQISRRGCSPDIAIAAIRLCSWGSIPTMFFPFVCLSFKN
jgi:hypothetical protein